MKVSKRSEQTTYMEPLALFLYDLMMHKMPVGDLESLIKQSITKSGWSPEFQSSGPIAEHAKKLSEEIIDATKNCLQRDLEMAFDNAEYIEDVKGLSKETLMSAVKILAMGKQKATEEKLDDSLETLEQKLISIANDEYYNTKVETTDEAAQSAKEIIEEMVEKGHMGKEKAETLIGDINNAVEEVKSGVTEPVEKSKDIITEEEAEEKSKIWLKIKEQVETKTLKAEEVEPESEEKITVKDASEIVEPAMEAYDKIEAKGEEDGDNENGSE